MFAARVTIEELDDLPRLALASELFRNLWGKDEKLGPPVNADLLRAMSHSGNYVTAAFDGRGEMQGALVGFLGRHHGRDHLHSHILGVRPADQARGAGFALKLHQRQWAIERGLDSVQWTFDPLVRRNAYFNLTKLGAEIDRYLVNFYGVMDDEQNHQDESDRILVRWDLRRAGADATDPPATPGSDPGASRPEPLLSADSDGTPVVSAAHPRTPTASIHVPEDIVRMRAEQPEIARAWRLALRQVLGTALNAGYRCQGVTRSGNYLLAR